MSSAHDVVLEFCAAWEAGDLENMLGYLDAGVVYQNVPGPVMNGIAAAREFIEPLFNGATRIVFDVLSIAASASGGEVLTERVDYLHFPGGVVTIPLMGIFVVRNGKITEWRDYADNASVVQSMKDAKVIPAD